MLPGIGKAAQGVDEEAAEHELKHIEAIILSMTPQERRDTAIIDGSRRKRIAAGSGNSVEGVNRFLKQFHEIRKHMKRFASLGASGMRGLGGMASMLKGSIRPPGM